MHYIQAKKRRLAKKIDDISEKIKIALLKEEPYLVRLYSQNLITLLNQLRMVGANKER